jgi:hypothetical protein
MPKALASAHEAAVAAVQSILTAEIDHGEVARGKYDFDVTGHYARADVFQLTVNEHPQVAVRVNEHAVIDSPDRD